MRPTRIGYNAKKNTKTVHVNKVVVVQPPRRIPVDIKNWRDYLKAAERGRRYAFYDMVDDLALDPIVSNAKERRIMAITNSEITFKKGDTEVDAMKEFIDTPEFEFLLTEMLLTKFYGKTVIELYWEKGIFKPYSVPRKHLNTKTKHILKTIGDTHGIPYEESEWLLNLGDDTDLGIFNVIAPFAIYKRNGGGDYAQYAELYGIPQMIGKYDANDENGREEMETAFKNRGSGGSMTLNKNSEIDVLQVNHSGSNDLHKSFLSWCDEQILIAINGQTMTTKDGSSYTQSKVHAETEDDINEADRRYIQRILNKELLPRLEKRGYPVSGGKFEFAEKGENLSIKERLEIATTVDDITESGVDDTFFYDEFGLPKGNKEKQVQEPITEPKEPEQKPTKPKKKKEKVTAKELSWFNKLRDFFANAPR